MQFFKCATICLGLSALIASAYIVKEGDTLWDLSDEFLHDPFAWPDLWENNRHIQDPHWIYPGDSIYFGDSIREEQVLRTPGDKNPCQTAVSDTNLPKGVSAVGCDNADARDGDFESMLGDLRNRDKKKKKTKSVDSYYYLQHPAPKIFNGYYQMNAPIILTIDSLKKDSSFFTIRSGEKKEPLIHLPETEVVLGIGKKTSLKAKKGDLVEIFDARAIDVPAAKGKSFDKFALLRITGIAKITAVGDNYSRAQIVQGFREIRINQSKARLKKPLNTINVTGYTPVKEVHVDSMAVIRYSMDPMLIIGAYSYVLIDKGSAQGYNSGDAVAIARAAVNESAVLIRELYSNNRRIEIGHKVSVTHSANVAK